MATKLWAILLMLATTFLTSTAQIMYKLATKSLELSLISILTNYFLIGGMLLYAVGGVMMIVSFRGGEVSVLYPIIATSYIWVSILSVFYLEEFMSPFKIAGVAAIFIGIVMIGLGSKTPAESVG